MRRLYYKATVEGCGFITKQSTLQADYEHMVPGMLPLDIDLNPQLGQDLKSCCTPASQNHEEAQSGTGNSLACCFVQ